ncbi:MAG: aminoacyl-tRNA hydrolase, partial [Planctomycetes bacterium]|nr:aminoacyl-tRNA hydrolase [Planctomycetota bacterium]
KPQTYMNLSGEAVGEMVAFYKVEPRDLLVVCDDIALPLGRLRVRASGSSGGQKGLDSILRRLGRRDVPRLRLGIGGPPGRMDATDYVLGRFGAADRQEVGVAVEEAALAVEVWVREGSEATMNRFNGPRTAEDREEED